MDIDVSSARTLLYPFNDPFQTTGHQELMSLRLLAAVHLSDLL